MSENNETPAPEVTVGLPSGLDQNAVVERKRALIAAGTDPLLAEKLAVDAEVQQAARNKQIIEEEKAATEAAKRAITRQSGSDKEAKK
jgi:hypothetical protein